MEIVVIKMTILEKQKVGEIDMKEGINLFHGDCLEVMKDIPDNSVDMILCDLPYGLTFSKWDSILDFSVMWDCYNRVIKDNGAIVLFGNEPFATKLRLSNIEDYRYDWIWDKQRGSNFSAVRIRPFNSFENICVFYKKQPTYNPQMREGKPYTRKQGYVGQGKQSGNMDRKNVITVNNGGRYPLSIISFPKVQRSVHPTQKPVDLLEYLIKTYTNEGEVVLDNCMGSGSTGVACINTNRRFIGIELDETYFNIAKERIEKHEQTN